MRLIGKTSAINSKPVRSIYASRRDESYRAHRGIQEYGMQSLKWSFLLNAGAIAIVLSYVGGIIGKAPNQGSTVTAAVLLKSIWPFVVGCISVALAGAAGFFNFSYLAASHP